MISDSTPSTFSGVDRHRMAAVEALADRVERTGADVAVDDADRGERERAGGRASRRGSLPGRAV